MLIDLWNVTPTGDWSYDTAWGREIAYDTIRVMRETGAYNLLAQVSKAAKRKGPQCAVCVGFGQVFAERAVRG